MAKKLFILTQIVDKNDPILGFFHAWVLEFSRHFSEVHVLCLKKGTYEFPSHVQVYSLGKEVNENRFKYTFRFYKYFSLIFFKIRPTYIFFHMGAIYNVLAVPFFLLRKIYGIKFLWWKAHGHINTFGRLASLFCDEIVTSTESGFPIATQKRRIVGQAIDTALFSVKEEVSRIHNRIIFVGRISLIKRVEVFIDVIKLLSKQGIDVEGRIIGPVGDEKYYAELQNSITKDNSTNIHFVGPCTQSELVEEYNKASIFLNTSVTNSMDKTVLEAMSCGCVPITANKAFKELLEDHELYFEQQDIKEYADCIQGIIKNNTVDMRRELRNRVCIQHSLGTFVGRIFKNIKNDKIIQFHK